MTKLFMTPDVASLITVSASPASLPYDMTGVSLGSPK